VLDEFVKKAFEKHGLNPKRLEAVPKVTLTNDYLRALTKEFLARAAAVKKCENCGGRSPLLRKEGHAKIFEQPMSRRDQVYMETKGMKQATLFDRPSRSADDSDSEDEGSDREDMDVDEDAGTLSQSPFSNLL
jgi:DNA-directed RNA polymerase I subunit RPA1